MQRPNFAGNVPTSQATSQPQRQRPNIRGNVPTSEATSQPQRQHPNLRGNIPTSEAMSQSQMQRPNLRDNVPTSEAKSQPPTQHPNLRGNVPTSETMSRKTGFQLTNENCCSFPLRYTSCHALNTQHVNKTLQIQKMYRPSKQHCLDLIAMLAGNMGQI